MAAQDKPAGLAQAVAEHVRRGDTLCFGFTHERRHAAAYEAARQFRDSSSLTLVAAGLLEYASVLVAAGAVRRLESAFAGAAYTARAPSRVLQNAYAGDADAPLSAGEAAAVLAMRMAKERAIEGGVDSFFAGIGLSHLAAWGAERRCRARGVEVALIAETGMVGFRPIAGDPYLFNRPNAASRQSVGSGGANDLAGGASEVMIVMPMKPGRFVETPPFTTSPVRRLTDVATDLCWLERGEGRDARGRRPRRPARGGRRRTRSDCPGRRRRPAVARGSGATRSADGRRGGALARV